MTTDCFIYSDNNQSNEEVITEDSEGKAFYSEGTAKVKDTGENKHEVLRNGGERIMNMREQKSRCLRKAKATRSWPCNHTKGFGFYSRYDGKHLGTLQAEGRQI